MASGLEGTKELKTVESTLDGKTFTNRPSLPGALAHGCLVDVDETDLYAMGGNSGKVYKISKGAASWITLTDMPTKR